MNADQRAELSLEWLAQLDAATVDLWTLGFDMVDRVTGAVVGTCGFKGPPGADGIVEIAYGVMPDQQGKGYATEAAEALVVYAFSGTRVRQVRAHTFAAVNASTRVLSNGFVRRIVLQHEVDFFNVGVVFALDVTSRGDWIPLAIQNRSTFLLNLQPRRIGRRYGLKFAIAVPQPTP
jgi:GNAT superfamily N-acetyltransferase